jgi:hypothetical protein
VAIVFVVLYVLVDISCYSYLVVLVPNKLIGLCLS